MTAYRLNGRKQWISNGGIADAYSVLALAPGGPSWFVVANGTEGFSSHPPEDKHGIRLSNTAALFLDDVTVPAENLVGGVEGRGLIQAQQVFGYTRLMVAAFGLGGGWAALDRAIKYSAERVQAGTPLSKKQGYTHKLIVPHVVRLEAARALIEETATRIDAGEGADGALNTEGAIAKYLATEAGNAAAEAAIQAHGGYGYTRAYLVEKIKRDVRITTIYEGTSEIMEMTIARDRWQQHLKTRGDYYRDAARSLDARIRRMSARRRRRWPGMPCRGAGGVPGRPPHPQPARAAPARRTDRLRRVRGRLARRAAAAADGALPAKSDSRFDAAALAAISRVFAREAALKVAEEGLRWVAGAGPGRRPGRRPSACSSPRRTGRAARRHGPRRRRPLSTGSAADHHDDHAPRADRGRRPRAIMPDAPDAASFWDNIKAGRYSISDVPPERWDPELYYDPDPHARTRPTPASAVGSASTRGSRGVAAADPAEGRTQMDPGQQWAVSAPRPRCSTPAGRTGRWTQNASRSSSAMRSAARSSTHQPADPVSRGSPVSCARHVFASLADRCASRPRRDRKGRLATDSEITEDTMPGELANVLAGRVANLFNFRGPNFTTDAACASGLAAMSAAVRGLRRPFDAAITGGIDRNMGVAGFVKFCKIGALSATGTRPFDAGADGFVMGEGAALFVLKRLADAERDGDRIYAVLLGIAGSSDGKGKGITAPNPVGQRLAVERAWAGRGLDPAAATCSRRTARPPASATPPNWRA